MGIGGEGARNAAAAGGVSENPVHAIMPLPPVSAIVLAGPSGAGKTTVGRALAARLGWAFVDADDVHSAEAVGKMTRGEPLTDADRAPWLDRLAARLARAAGDGAPVVLACSALRAVYRERLRAGASAAGGRIVFVWLDVPAARLRRRLASRRGHFAGPGLLQSQLDASEPAPDLVRVAATAAPAEVARTIAASVVPGPA